MKFGLLLLTAFVAQTAFAADDYLVSKALHEVQESRIKVQALIINNNPNSYELRQVDADLSKAQSELERSLQMAPPPPPPPADPIVGYYCSAACTQSDRQTPDLRYTVGASGNFEAQAREAAINKTQSQYSCGWNVVVTSCSPQFSQNRFDSYAACTDSSGKADLRYVRAGAASSLAEAQTIALKATQSQYSCGWSVKTVGSSEYLRPAYCTAACTDSSGNPDSRYSKGAEGRNKADASAKALIATQSAYSCGWSVIVTQCSEN